MEKTTIYLRAVIMDDARTLYDWRNDELVRANSFHTDTLLWNEHRKWLESVLQDEKQHFYILMLDEASIGQVRIAEEKSIGIVNYSIAEAFRGQGFGHAILQLVENKMAECNSVKQLKAYVKSNNIASQHIFAGLGYHVQSEAESICYIKDELKRKSIPYKQMPQGGGIVPD